MAMKYYGFWRSLAACRVRIAVALMGVKAAETSINVMEALKVVESNTAKERGTGRHSHGATGTPADICIATQGFGARFFNCDTALVPTVIRVFNECMKLEAFDKSHPLKQPGAPKEIRH